MVTMTMMAVGGAIGAMLRYSISLGIGASVFVVSGPLATLVVNVVGSAFMGCFAGSFAAGMVLPEAWHGFLAVGVLGALTTFSSLALDAGQLWQTKGVVIASVYVVVSVVLFLATFAAMFITARHNGIWQ